jgi:hypothetical protein
MKKLRSPLLAAALSFAAALPAHTQTEYLQHGDFASFLWLTSWQQEGTGLNPTVTHFDTDGVNHNGAFVVHPGSAGFRLVQSFQAVGGNRYWISVDVANAAQQGNGWYGSRIQLIAEPTGSASQVLDSALFWHAPPIPTRRTRLAGLFQAPGGGPLTVRVVLRADPESGRVPIQGQTPLVYLDNASVTDFCPGTTVWRGTRVLGDMATLDIYGPNGAYAFYVSPSSVAPIDLQLGCPWILDLSQMWVFVQGGIGTGTGLFRQTFPTLADPLVQGQPLFWQTLHVTPGNPPILSIGKGTMQAFF